MREGQRKWTLAVGLAALAMGCPRNSGGPDVATNPAAGNPGASRNVVTLHIAPVSGPAMMARADIPWDWIALAPAPARAEFMGPDRRSRVYVRAMAADKPCSRLAREYAHEVIQSWGGPPRSRLVSRNIQGGEVDFELARTDPKPLGELVLGRVLCEDGALAIVSCAGPVASESILRPLCMSMLNSLRIQPQGATARR